MKCIAKGFSLAVVCLTVLAGQYAGAETRSVISDIQLGQGGALHGQVVDRQGRPVAHQEVTLAQGDTAVARTTTDAQGNFQLAGLNSGVYFLNTAGTTSAHRLWAEHVAPPAARPGVMVVSDSAAVRGNIGALGGLGGLGAAAAIATGSYFVIDELTDDNKPAS